MTYSRWRHAAGRMQTARLLLTRATRIVPHSVLAVVAASTARVPVAELVALVAVVVLAATLVVPQVAVPVVPAATAAAKL